MLLSPSLELLLGHEGSLVLRDRLLSRRSQDEVRHWPRCSTQDWHIPARSPWDAGDRSALKSSFACEHGTDNPPARIHSIVGDLKKGYYFEDFLSRKFY